MNDRCLRTECESLAIRLGIEVRTASGSPAGLCTVRGKRVIFIDSEMDNSEIVRMFIRSFRTLDLEGVFIIPALRDRIDMELQ